MIDGPICQGVIFPSTRIAVICEEDLTGRKRLGGTRRGNASGHKVFHEDLVVGSYVVHDHHGVAIYKGNVTQSIGAIERDYFLLEYRKGDRLYVPAEQINLLRPYTGEVIRGLAGWEEATGKKPKHALVRNSRDCGRSCLPISETASN